MTFLNTINQLDFLAWYILGIIALAFVIVLITKGIRSHIATKKKLKKYNEDLIKYQDQLDKHKDLKQKTKKKEIKVVAKKELKPVKNKEKEFQDEKELKSFILKKAHSKTSIKFWREWFLEKYYPTDIILIQMETSTGFRRLFTIKKSDDGFKYKGGNYLFVDSQKIYNADAKLYQLDYHQDCSLPISTKIPVDKIKQTLESLKELDVSHSVNPSVLHRFIKSKIAEGILKGTQLDEFMRKLNTFIIVIMVAVLVHLVLFLYASGILKNIQLPF